MQITITYPLGKWLQTVDKNMKKLAILYIATGMQNGTTTLESILAVSYKLKPILNIRSSNSTQVFTQEKTWMKRKHISTQRFMHKCLHQHYS